MSTPSHPPHCQHILENICDYIDGDLQAELCAELEEHMRGCENCRIVVNTLRKTVEICKDSQETVELPPGLQERLLTRLNLNS